MKVDALLTVQSKELSERQWRRLFSRLRFTDLDGVEYEPWMVYPRQGVKIPRGAWSLMPDSVVHGQSG
jgi:hypothetical protein